MEKLVNLIHTVHFLKKHPLSRRNPWASAKNFVGWQLGSRLLHGAAVVPFVDDAVLVVEPGMVGATGNIYSGLHEFEEMSFLLHLLRSEDVFLDVGANVGTYTILAAAVRGCRCVAVEPVESTALRLARNLRINGVADAVRVVREAVGSEPGVARFTVDLDTVNHVAAPGEGSRCVDVTVTTLDSICGDVAPVLIKVDVEGFEDAVLSGGARTLADPRVLAIIIELNAHAGEYGFHASTALQRLERVGLQPVVYDPFTRTMEVDAIARRASGNLILVRRMDDVRRRLVSAPSFRALGVVV